MPRTIAFFSGATAATGQELWETDGTAAGSGLVIDIVPGTAGSLPANFAPAGAGAVVFTAADVGYNSADGARPNTYQLFVSNGTAAGTEELNNGFATADSFFILSGKNTYLSTFSDFTPVGGGRTLFFGATPTSTTQLWSTDSTVAGTVSLHSFGSSPRVNSGGGNLAPLGNGRTLFAIGGIGSDDGLWGTDGTAAGTVQLIPSTSFVSSTPLGNGKAVTTVADGNGAVLLGITDGTAAGTSGLAHLAAASAITPIGKGKGLFTAQDGLAGTELWVTDGTAAGTLKLVQGPAPGTNDPYGFNPSQFTTLGDGRFVFTANDGSGNNAL